LKPVLKPGKLYPLHIKSIHAKNERKNKMKLTLTHIGLLTIKAQKYIPVAVMALILFAGIIGMYPPESGGGTGM
jgi:hypothetical protein